MESKFKWMPEQASTFSGHVDLFYYFMVALSAFFTIAIAIGIIFLIVRYRRKHKLEKGADIHGSNVLEITWSVIPLIISMFIFFWAAHLFFMYEKPPKDAMEILVTGKQWMWKIQHPSGNREINELHVPAGQPVKLTMTSEDVIHSFFVPAFRVKRDVLPGRYTAVWFEATKPGKYHLFCAEYCGTEHSAMRGSVYVMSPGDYQNWLAGGGDANVPPVEAGQKLFAQLNCISCHNPESGARGPNLENIMGTMQELEGGLDPVKVDEAFLRESILNPQAKIAKGYEALMPTFKGLVGETQLMQLIAYIKSLTAEAEAGEE